MFKRASVPADPAESRMDDPAWRSHRGRRLVLGCGLALIAVGAVYAAHWRGTRADQDLREDLLSQAVSIARTIDPEQVQELSFTAADGSAPIFGRLRRQLVAYTRAMDLISVYSVAQRGGRLFFGPENLAADSPQASAPGTEYRQPPEGLQGAFAEARSIVVGPYEDEYGTFVSAFAPVTRPRSGTTLMMVGVDLEAAQWRALIWRARLAGAGGVLLPALVLLAGLAVVNWRRHLPLGCQRVCRYAEAYLVASVGLALTLVAALVAHDEESRSRRQVFSLVAESQANRVAEALFDLRNNQLAALTRFYESSEDVTREEFRHFTRSMTLMRAIGSVGWAPRVTGPLRPLFEQRVAGEESACFRVFERSAEGRDRPAAARDEHFPLLYVEPAGEAGAGLGLDLAGDPCSRQAIQEAYLTRRSVGVMAASCLRADQQMLHVYQRLCAGLRCDQGSSIGLPLSAVAEGVLLVTVRLGELLQESTCLGRPDDESVVVELHLLQPEGPARFLASSSATQSPVRTDADVLPAATRARRPFVVLPLFVFGQTFALVAHPGQAFEAAHPARLIWWSIGAGLLITVALTGFVGSLTRHRLDLEKQVQGRTAELRESETRFRGLFDHAISGVAVHELVLDEQGQPVDYVFLEANPSFQTQTGLSLDQVVGRRASEVFPNDRAALLDVYECVVRTGEPISFEQYFEPLDRHFQISAFRVSPGCFASVFRDVTEQKHAEETLKASREQFMLAVDGSQDGIWDWDLRDGSLFLSARWKEMIGYQDDELPNAYSTFETRLHPEDRPRVVDYLERYLRGESATYSVDFRLRHKDGTYRWILARGEAIRDENGLPCRMAGSHTDITHHKLAEEQLRRSKEDLEQVNAVLERSIERANLMAVRAEAANRAKSEFLANMSHEIRTPMTAILGYAELVGEGCPARCEYGAKGLRESLDAIQRNGAHLLELINDVLDLSKVEAGKMTADEVVCSAHQIVAEVASLVRVRAQAKGLDFDVQFDGPIPEKILTDPLRLRQILVNLVFNAVKFTDSGSVRLIVRLSEEGRRLVFDVVDTGVGMTPSQVEKLFVAFGQVDASTTRRHGGTGLGLAISRQLARLLHGDVMLVETEAGAGSRFRAEIAIGPLEGVRMLECGNFEALVHEPRRDESRSRSGGLEEHRDGPPLSGLNVLLVEDGPDNKRLIEYVLRKAGAAVTLAENGRIGTQAALAAMEAGRAFDVILMDMQMPVMDGYEATRHLRQAGYTWPIVALTAHAMSDEVRKCLDAGCDDHAAKPINRDRLVALVREHACWMLAASADH